MSLFRWFLQYWYRKFDLVRMFLPHQLKLHNLFLIILWFVQIIIHPHHPHHLVEYLPHHHPQLKDKIQDKLQQVKCILPNKKSILDLNQCILKILILQQSLRMHLLYFLIIYFHLDKLLKNYLQKF